MDSKKNKNRNKITFHNKINSSFRQIHVDGALGGITPRGLINLNFFAERFPIPKSTDFDIKENKTLGDKLTDSIDSKTGIIREYEFGVYMSLDTAKSFVRLFEDKMRELETLEIEKEKPNAISNSKQ